MSIQINKAACIGCGGCIEVCPGSLITQDEDGKSYIKYPRDCWGCTSCMKECPVQAIQYYLGADIGGRGSKMSVKQENELLIWSIEKKDGQVHKIEINKNDANKY